MTNNHHIIDHIKQLQAGELINLPIAELYAFQCELKRILEQAKLAKNWLDGAISQKYQGKIEALRVRDGKTTGTINLAENGFKITSNIPKKVLWDQQKLKEMTNRIREGGGSPEEYVDISYTVPERKYTAWPDHIRESFETARTLQAGKPTIKIEEAA